jgi:hypothetical protein
LKKAPKAAALDLRCSILGTAVFAEPTVTQIKKMICLVHEGAESGLAISVRAVD